MLKKFRDGFFFCLSKGLYLIGHWISIPMYKFDLGFLYPSYVFFMHYSGEIQEYSGLDGPWNTPERTDNND